MKTIEDLLKNLARPEVLEFGLVTNRLPSVNIGGKFEPVDDEAPSTERLMQMLVTMGGGRHVDSLSDKPVQWTTRLDGVGVIAVAAIMRKDVVQARFTVAKREGAGGRSSASIPAQAAPAQAAPLPAAPPAHASTSVRPQTGPQVVPSQRPQAPAPTPPPAMAKAPPSGTERAVPAVRVQPSSASMAAAKAAPIQPQVIKSVTASQSVPVVRPEPATVPQVEPRPAPATGPAPAAAAPPPPAPSPPPGESEWDDDDEPTLQTLSPPVTGQPGEPRPKPARKPEEAPAATRPTAEEQRAAQERAAQERAAKERLERAAQERGLAQERAAQERLAQLARERLEQQRKERDRPATSTPAAAPAKPPMRRISTPTSVDAVDVEITTNDTGATAAPPVAPPPVAANPPPVEIDLEAPAAPTPATPTAEPKRSPVAPGVAPTPEKERGGARVESTASLDSFLAMAVSARASDLFVIAGRPVLLRVATDLLPRTQPVAPEHVERIAKEILPSRVREALDQEGAATFALEHTTHGRFRVTASRQRTGLALAFRVVPRDPPTLGGLGLPESLASVARYQRGLVLVTSPAGHGKSSTLAALVDLLNRETSRHIVTVEDAIEHVHPRKKSLVSQREVLLHSRSKARAIALAAREDADVIVIGEITDVETARLALVAVESGRLVLAGMPSPGVAGAIERILDLFSEGERAWARTTLASALRLVVGQRLVPSTERTRLHAAVELLSWSVALHELVRSERIREIAALQERGKPPFVTRLGDALAELVRAQKVTADAVSQLVGPHGSVGDQGRSP